LLQTKSAVKQDSTFVNSVLFCFSKLYMLRSTTHMIRSSTKFSQYWANEEHKELKHL